MLNNDVLKVIISYLGDEMAVATKVCKEWRRLARNVIIYRQVEAVVAYIMCIEGLRPVQFRGISTSVDVLDVFNLVEHLEYNVGPAKCPKLRGPKLRILDIQCGGSQGHFTISTNAPVINVLAARYGVIHCDVKADVTVYNGYIELYGIFGEIGIDRKCSVYLQGSANIVNNAHMQPDGPVSHAELASL